jgi:hypothetical protein
VNKKRRFASLAAALIILSGCDSASTEDDPGSVADLCMNIFSLCINPILQGPIGPGIASGLGPVSCASSSCHVSGGAGGAFILFQNAALNSTDEAFNFNSAQAFVNAASPSQSKLLAEPLVGDAGVASIGPHNGGDIFVNTAGTCYREISNWASTPNGTCPATCTVLTPTGGSGQLVPADLTTCTP